MVFDIPTETFTERKPLLEARRKFGCTIFRHPKYEFRRFLVLAGDSPVDPDGGIAPIKTTHMYDLEYDLWYTGPVLVSGNLEY